MTWNPDPIDWLALSEPDYANAIAELLSDNRVLNGMRVRPTGHPNWRALYRDATLVAQSEIQLALDNAGSGRAYQTSQDVQHAIMNGVTKYLMSEHYIFELLQPRPGRCQILEGQVWFPASYYVVRRFVGQRFYRRLTFFGWEDGIPQGDFYGDDDWGSRHPAIVIDERSDGAYWMIPLSHSRKGPEVDIGGRRAPCFARYNFPFLASWAMLERDKHAHNVRGFRIRTDDFVWIRQRTMRYIDAVERT